MKATARDADNRVSNPDPSIRAYLIYGPDRGLTHERAKTLVAAILEDPNDPFALTQLTEDDLKSDPAGLADAMAALSLTGGKRLVRVRLTGETGSGPIIALIDALEKGSLAAEAVLLVESGDLTPRGKLRKTFELAKNAIAIACYADTAHSLESLCEDMLKIEGLSLTRDARDVWLPRLEGDRALARGEIEKLILYKGLRSQRGPGDDVVTRDDIEAVAADQGEAQLDSVLAPALLGLLDKADSAYHRSITAGGSAVGILRALQRRLDQLGAVHAAGGHESSMARSGAPRYSAKGCGAVHRRGRRGGELPQ